MTVLISYFFTRDIIINYTAKYLQDLLLVAG